MIQQEAKYEKLKEILFARVNICRLVKGTVRAPDLSKREKSSSPSRLLDPYLIFNTKNRDQPGGIIARDVPNLLRNEILNENNWKWAIQNI